MSGWQTELTLKSIGDEVARAREKFPDATHALAALQEEVGELANALIELQRGNAACAADGADAVRAEAIQVAAMAVRIIEEGDPEFPACPTDRAASDQAGTRFRTVPAKTDIPRKGRP